MKNKTALVMIEQAILLFVFALAAALCLHAFVTADAYSRRESARDTAYLLAQNAAEAMKHASGDAAVAAEICGGTADADGFTSYHTGDGQPLREGGELMLRVRRCDSGQPLLGEAEITVTDASGEVLATLTVRYQEDSDAP